MIDPLIDSSLTLFNKYGEKYEAGAMSTFTKTNAKIRMRWLCNKPLGNTSPFTHAMVHTNRSVLKVTGISPFEPGTFPKEIELEFAV